jgi:hypothetical protein
VGWPVVAEARGVMMGVGKYAVMEEAVEREVDVMVKEEEKK